MISTEGRDRLNVISALVLYCLFSAAWSCGAARTITVATPVTAMRKQIRQGDLLCTLEVTIKEESDRPGSHVAQANLSVESTSQQPVPFRFPSSQQYDFLLLNSGGREIWRWSAGKFFAMVILDRNLTSEPWLYRASIPLTNNEGDPLNPGVYRIQARLTGHPELEIEVPIEIEGK